MILILKFLKNIWAFFNFLIMIFFISIILVLLIKWTGYSWFLEIYFINPLMEYGIISKKVNIINSKLLELLKSWVDILEKVVPVSEKKAVTWSEYFWSIIRWDWIWGPKDQSWKDWLYSWTWEVLVDIYVLTLSASAYFFNYKQWPPILEDVGLPLPTSFFQQCLWGSAIFIAITSLVVKVF